MVDVPNVTHLLETVSWTAVLPQLEDGWWPTGGAVDPASDQGIMNWQAQVLGNRSLWLKDQIDTKVIKTTGNQSASGTKTFQRLQLQPALGQAEPSLELIGFEGEVNGLYPIPAAASPVNQPGLRLSLNGAARIDFSNDNVVRAASAGSPMQIDPAMLSTLAMPGLKANSGWQRMPNGLIIQWGIQSVSATTSITFPISFPTTAMWAIAAGFYVDATRVAAFNVNGLTLTGMTINQTTVTSGPTGWRWFAIGF